MKTTTPAAKTQATKTQTKTRRARRRAPAYVHSIARIVWMLDGLVLRHESNRDFAALELAYTCLRCVVLNGHDLDHCLRTGAAMRRTYPPLAQARLLRRLQQESAELRAALKAHRADLSA